VLLTILFYFLSYYSQSNDDNVSNFGDDDMHGAHPHDNDDGFQNKEDKSVSSHHFFLIISM
jgi:hypothetical protein